MCRAADVSVDHLHAKSPAVDDECFFMCFKKRSDISCPYYSSSTHNTSVSSTLDNMKEICSSIEMQCFRIIFYGYDFTSLVQLFKICYEFFLRHFSRSIRGVAFYYPNDSVTAAGSSILSTELPKFDSANVEVYTCQLIENCCQDVLKHGLNRHHRFPKHQLICLGEWLT